MFNLDIVKALKSLSASRPIFHSEADFQHAIAWHIHGTHPELSVRLELPFRSKDASEYLDLWFSDGKTGVALELKYKTRSLKLDYDNEPYHLKNQSAQDIGRYDFLADVARLERFVGTDRTNIGYAVMLTNDQGYWHQGRPGTVDEDFRLSEEQELVGKLEWREHAAKGTTLGREHAIYLKGRYNANWQNYSEVASRGGTFRYLAWRVECGQTQGLPLH
jgi:hypothetical protein